ncbi:MAG: LLM class F420-dependent oxidoreductase [candidate division NC10 bacterium]|mgnify:CR=1 FL=1
MEFGVVIHNRSETGKREVMVGLAQRADRLNFDSIWVTDHVVLPTKVSSRYPYSATGAFPIQPHEDYMEPLTVLAYLAACTERVRLGVSVMILPHRNPILAAKMLSTLDVLSGGRVIAGVGVGWLEEEFQALGLPPFRERGAYSDECIRIFKELWTKEDPSFEGRYHRFRDIKFAPKPLQKPHPPIWVGGQTRRALERAGTLGDAWHPLGLRPPVNLEPDELRDSFKVVREAAAKAGRDPKSVGVAFRGPLNLTKAAEPAGRRLLTGSPSQVADDIKRYHDVEVRHMVFDVLTNDVRLIEETMDRFANEVRPELP